MEEKKTLLCIQQEDDGVIIEMNADSLDDFGFLGNALLSFCIARSEVYELLKAVVTLYEEDPDNIKSSIKQRDTYFRKRNNNKKS